MHKKTLLFKNAELLVTMDVSEERLEAVACWLREIVLLRLGGKSCALPLLMKKLISMGTS